MGAMNSLPAHVVTGIRDFFEEIPKTPPYPVTYPAIDLTMKNTERRFHGNAHFEAYEKAEDALYAFLCQKWNDEADGVPSNILHGYALELRVEPADYSRPNHRGFPTTKQAVTFEALVAALFNKTDQ